MGVVEDLRCPEATEKPRGTRKRCSKKKKKT